MVMLMKMSKWKPKVGEVYFILEIKGGYPSWEDYIWRDTPRDESRYEGGIVRRCAEDTLELARKMLFVAKKEAQGNEVET